MFFSRSREQQYLPRGQRNKVCLRVKGNLEHLHTLVLPLKVYVEDMIFKEATLLFVTDIVRPHFSS